jgi:MSHA biogenesis protein MshJ
MKPHLLKLESRIDAMSVRERALMFAACAAVMVFFTYAFALDALFARQKALRTEIAQQQNNIAGIDMEISALVQAHAIDPDRATRERIAATKERSATLVKQLRTVQNGLVAPEAVAPLLESILRHNSRLRLLSLQSLPVSSMADPFDPDAGSDAAADAAKAAASAATAAAAASATGKSPARAAMLIYRHGVRVTVRGNYMDMLDYMTALESMPGQLFWGKAQLDVDTWPDARLTLTLYTLSLDKKWMTL